MQSDYHHDRCRVCGQRFLGCTDADMVKHIIEEHPEHGDAVGQAIGMPKKKRKTCDSCGKEYVTMMGECPWCYHRGPPYR